MFPRSLSVILAGALLLVSTAAYAVDVRNDDDQPHELLISVWKDSTGTDTTDTLVTLQPGQSQKDVCATCIIALGKSDEAESVAAENTEVVTIIKPGLLKVQ